MPQETTLYVGQHTLSFIYKPVMFYAFYIHLLCGAYTR